MSGDSPRPAINDLQGWVDALWKPALAVALVLLVLVALESRNRHRGRIVSETAVTVTVVNMISGGRGATRVNVMLPDGTIHSILAPSMPIHPSGSRIEITRKQFFDGTVHYIHP